MLLEIKDYQSLRDEMQRFCRFLVDNNASETTVFNGRLAVTELVGNVLKHAQTSATVKVVTEDGYFAVYVHSSKPFVPPVKSCCSSVNSEHGRGLYLVDSVCIERTLTSDGAIKIILKK